MATAPPTASEVPAAPDRTDRATFSVRATAFFGYVKNTMWSDMTAFSANAYANAVDAAASATAASTSKVNASASEINAAANAVAAASSSGAAMWVSGSFTAGQVRYSPTNQRVYRKVGGAGGTIDPASDAANWALVSTDPLWLTKTTNYTAVAGDAIRANTTAGSFTITLPASPADNVVVNIKDYAGTFGTNKLTIDRNGKNIMGLAEDMDITTGNLNMTLTFISATNDWRF